jgi:hypothetical protein
VGLTRVPGGIVTSSAASAPPESALVTLQSKRTAKSITVLPWPGSTSLAAGAVAIEDLLWPGCALQHVMPPDGQAAGVVP